MKNNPAPSLGILGDEGYDEMVDEEELEVVGGTGAELVFWPRDLQ